MSGIEQKQLQRNLEWFSNEFDHATLKSVELVDGSLRSLNPFKIDFEYPITAIAGSNGSGKSTILAMAACAFHNNQQGTNTLGRKVSHYRYGDFFIQTSNEIPPSGLIIEYGILYDKWYRAKPGFRIQTRRKKKNGNWNNYNSRIQRKVIYLGLSRAIPHFERSTHKTYKRFFSHVPYKHEREVTNIASRIIGKNYTEFSDLEHSKYNIPFVTSNGVEYSGFNMGAGENVVFTILSSLFDSEEDKLLIIDEIETGLHERAQVQLIKELDKLCASKRCQIVCTTHSNAILRTLPSQGRILVESSGSQTLIYQDISADFASGRLGSPQSYDLLIYVEDKCSKEIVSSILPHRDRIRVKVEDIGSHGAVLRHLSVNYREERRNCMCLLDGDQSVNVEEQRKSCVKNAEITDSVKKADMESWTEMHIKYLPGTETPEQWLLEKSLRIIKDESLLSNSNLLVKFGNIDKSELVGLIEASISIGKKGGIFELSQKTNIDNDKVISYLVEAIKEASPESFSELIESVTNVLNEVTN